MPDPVWKTAGVDETAARIKAINGTEGRIPFPQVEVALGDVAGACLVIFTRELTEEERVGLRAQVLALSPLIRDLHLVGGVAVTEEFEGKVSKTRGEVGLQVVDSPGE